MNTMTHELNREAMEVSLEGQEALVEVGAVSETKSGILGPNLDVSGGYTFAPGG